MNYTTFENTLEQVQLPLEIDAMSVYRALEQGEDGRHKRGVRYSMALILTLILLAKVAGMTTPAAIAHWVRGLSKLVEPGAADHAAELSLCGDVQ
jgi:hypothetical protein